MRGRVLYSAVCIGPAEAQLFVPIFETVQDAFHKPRRTSAGGSAATHDRFRVASTPISRANISPNALKVLYRLRDSGYQAFLVGGAVRDLLLGLHPKDFDIATNAHPEEVRRCFATAG